MWYCKNVSSDGAHEGLRADINRYYLWEINHTYDTSWTGFNLFVWALLECHLAIIFACAPSLRAFLRKYLGDAWNRTFRSCSYSHSHNRSRNDKNVSQNASTLRHSNTLADIESGKAYTMEQSVIEKPSDESMEVQTESGVSRGARSSFTITSPAEYEAYNMRTLSKHGYKRRDTSVEEYMGHDWNDPKQKHDAFNSVSSAVLCNCSVLTESAALVA